MKSANVWKKAYEILVEKYENGKNNLFNRIIKLEKVIENLADENRLMKNTSVWNQANNRFKFSGTKKNTYVIEWNNGFTSCFTNKKQFNAKLKTVTKDYYKVAYAITVKKV